MPEPIFSEMTDIMLGYDTDLHFEDGDLMLTTGVDFIEREIYKLLITEPGDWRLNQQLGCSPVKFAGEPNTRENAKLIEQYITENLTFTVSPAILKVRAVPVDYSSILIFIDIYSSNNLEISIPFEFNYTNGISKLDKADPRVLTQKTDKYQINDITNLRKPNKYWDRMRDRSTTNLI